MENIFVLTNILRHTKHAKNKKKNKQKNSKKFQKKFTPKYTGP
jgi:hypothetical protein